MFDEKTLDRMNFGDLSQSLHYVLKKIEEIEDGLPEGEDDLRLDWLYVFANKIITRMDAIIRDYGNPEVLAKWNKSKAGYEEKFEQYADTFLDDDTLIDFARPENPESTPGAEGPPREERRAGAEGRTTGEADILKLEELRLRTRLSVILDKVKRIDEEDPDNDDDPRISQLLKEADLITKRLDPIMRERFRHDPAKLAEWDEIIHSCDDLEELPWTNPRPEDETSSNRE